MPHKAPAEYVLRALQGMATGRSCSKSLFNASHDKGLSKAKQGAG
jgi:hypothetical protein